MHAYHHPDRIRRDHEWVDWFAHLKDQNPDQTVGLEFVEGLWAGKLVAIALLITVAIIIVSVVWVVKGGNLQTVFTVIGFVFTGAAGKYCPTQRVALPQSPMSQFHSPFKLTSLQRKLHWWHCTIKSIHRTENS